MPKPLSEAQLDTLDQLDSEGISLGEMEHRFEHEKGYTLRHQKSFNSRRNKAYSRYVEFEGDRVVKISFRKKRKNKR